MTSSQQRQGSRRRDSVIAIVVSYVLLLHVLLGAYAQAAVMGDDAYSPLFVLCDPHGVVANQASKSDASSSSELNNLVCKSACALGTALSGMPQGIIVVAGDQVSPLNSEPPKRARGLFVIAYARAPPALASSLAS